MPPRKGKKQEFRKCDCGQSWETRDEFLQDKMVKIIGYQPDFVSRKYSHFLFFHRAKGCGGFIGIRASEFGDLRETAYPKDLCFGEEDCPGYCTDTLDLRVCSVACRNATDREVAARISRRRILRRMKPATEGRRPKSGAKKKAAEKTAGAR